MFETELDILNILEELDAYKSIITALKKYWNYIESDRTYCIDWNRNDSS